MKKYRLVEGGLAWRVAKHKVALLVILLMAALVGLLQIGAAFADEAEAEEQEATDSKEAAVVREAVIEPTIAFESIGMFQITYYCKEDYPHICNDGDAAQTATGTVPTPGRTIAVDPDVIPYGTEVLIGDVSYIAEDCGQAIKGNRIDICVSTHEEAEELGTYVAEAFEVKEK